MIKYLFLLLPITGFGQRVLTAPDWSKINYYPLIMGRDSHELKVRTLSDSTYQITWNNQDINESEVVNKIACLEIKTFKNASCNYVVEYKSTSKGNTDPSIGYIVFAIVRKYYNY